MCYTKLTMLYRVRYLVYMLFIYKVGHEKLARLPFAFEFGYCINFCIYAMLRNRPN